MFGWRRCRPWNGLLVAVLLAACAGDDGEHHLSPVTVHTPEWAGDTNRDMTGFYWETLFAVFEPVGIRLEPTFTSYTDSIADVQARRCDMALSTYANEYADVIYPKWPQEVDQPVAVQSAGTPFRGVSSLDGARVGWVHGYAFDQYLPDGLRFVEFESVESALGGLSRGDIDVLIDYRPDIDRALAELGLDPDTVDIHPAPHLARAVFPMFRNDERGRALAEIYDRRMAELFSDGTLHQLHAEHARGAPLVPRQM